MFTSYFKTAFRNLLRNKTYAFINVAGLSIGLACAMLIILYVKDEVSYDRFHQNVSNIYRVARQSIDVKGVKGGKDGNTGYLQGPKFTANVPGIQSFVRVQWGEVDIKKGTEVTSGDVLNVDSSFFTIFSFPLLDGNAKTCLTDPYSIVLSADEAKKQFGSTDVVGKTMLLKDDSVFRPYTVTAVAKNTPQNSSIQFRILLPFKMSDADAQNPENWFNVFLNTFVVLDPHANPASVAANMQRFYEKDSKDAFRTISEKFGPIIWRDSYLLQPYTDIHLNTDMPAGNGLVNASNPTYSYILSGIAFFVLIIACINFINLTVRH